jgi:sorbitol-specific phosphotransferase system component IIA
VTLPFGQRQANRLAVAGHGRVDFRGQSAARTPDGLCLRPPFPPAAC